MSPVNINAVINGRKLIKKAGALFLLNSVYFLLTYPASHKASLNFQKLLKYQISRNLPLSQN
ncbi:hypothetical protein, partial [Pseudomonas agarici]|uniref:hypothetical protein n=1 Tax=Pseudomonas agarici TaxID=46677 RepID=UPI001B7FA278